MITNNEFFSLKKINEKQSVTSEILYSSRKFNFLNASKCDYIYTHFDSKMSMFFGVNGNNLSAPFSAPFSMPRYVTDFVKYNHVHSFFKSLKQSFDESDLESVKITIPPGFYNENVISKVSHSLGSLGFELLYRDLNSHISLQDFLSDNLPSKCRSKIRASEKNSNVIILANTLEEQERAYNIIKENRVIKGYPLRLTWEQVKETITNVAKAEFFISITDGVDSAAAMVFEVSDKVAQVVYWGANETGEKKHAMYYLPFKIVEHYKEKGFEYLDVGPSSENGVVNEGLNEYKQMIGCINTLKETWVYNK